MRTVTATTLEHSYAHCRRVTSGAGTTYYWSTWLLPSVKRHHVWALYALCRHADDLVDGHGGTAETRAAALDDFEAQLFDDLVRGRSEHPVLRAVVHTTRAFDIDPGCYRRFFASMRMDLIVAHYRTWDDLLGYMDGSAAVIGELMATILEPPEWAIDGARALGLAFQLTNFLRDVAEDLDRGRVYIPAADLERFGADPRRRLADEAWSRLMAFEIERCRVLYRTADVAIEALPPAARRCVRAARVLYSEILDRIEAADGDVFRGRVRVPLRRKLRVVAEAGARR